ncbi:unnamed protein product [Sphagnum balticum]
MSEVEQWKAKRGALHSRPRDFDPTRYVSFSVKEAVEEPVDAQHIHDLVLEIRRYRLKSLDERLKHTFLQNSYGKANLQDAVSAGWMSVDGTRLIFNRGNRMIFLNIAIQSKSSIEEADNLASDVSLPALLVGVDSLIGGKHQVSELPGWEDAAGPFLEIFHGQVVSGGDDTDLVDSADELDHDLLAPVIINDFEFSDVIVFLHDFEEFE